MEDCTLLEGKKKLFPMSKKIQREIKGGAKCQRKLT